MCNNAITKLIDVFIRKQKPDFKKLVADLYKPLCMIVREEVKDFTRVEEIVTAAFRSLEENLHCFTNEDSALAYLKREIEILCGEINDQIVFEEWVFEDMLEVEEDFDYIMVEDRLDAQLRLSVIETEINKLPPRQHQVIMLLLSDYATDMIARELDIKKRTVLNHKNLAIKTIRKALKDQGLLTIVLLANSALLYSS